MDRPLFFAVHKLGSKQPRSGSFACSR